MESIKIAVCNDENLFLQSLCRMIKKAAQKDKIDIELHCCSGDLESGENDIIFDMVFLDVVLGGHDGFEAAKEILKGNEQCVVAMFTSYSEFAKKGYEVNIFRYILKDDPETIIYGQIQDCLKEYFRRNRIVGIPYKDHTDIFCVDEIDYLESVNRIIYIRGNGQEICWHRKMSDAEMVFDGYGFIRCHRGFLVNSRAVIQMKKNQLILRDGTRIPVGRTYKERVKTIFRRI